MYISLLPKHIVERCFRVVIFLGYTGKERSGKVLVDMGPAVFNGGFSTFLAFFLVAFSDSYVFQTFFKVCLRPGISLFWGLMLSKLLLFLKTVSY